MPRIATLLAALLLAFPASALAQGAGDDQYQDPFGDAPAQGDSGSGGGGGGSGEDGGLSDSPPVGGSGSSGGGSSGSGSSGGGTAGATGTAGTSGTTGAAPEAAAGDQLPRTGSDPWLLMLLGGGLVLGGVGLRLRTIDPDAY